MNFFDDKHLVSYFRPKRRKHAVRVLQHLSKVLSYTETEDVVCHGEVTPRSSIAEPVAYETTQSATDMVRGRGPQDSATARESRGV